jgi:DNA-binding LytR/AlgR family response regulator
MTKIKVLVVEDDALTAEAISVSLRKHALDPIKVCDTGEGAIDYLTTNSHVDLILMDIVLAGELDGIETAQAIRRFRQLPIVYLTDHVDEKHIERSKKTFPAGYLAKPFNEAELVRAIEFAFNKSLEISQTTATPADDVFVRTDNQEFVRLFFKDVLYLEAARSYCKVVTDTATYTLCSSMNHIHEKFDSKDFIRVHRSYVVNTKRITKLDGNVIYVDNAKVDMGKEFRENLMKNLKLIK